jgi:5'-nucleotidase
VATRGTILCYPERTMQILLSNDDGVHSPGLTALEKGLTKQGHDVIVVAPSQDRSAVGHSLTLHKPLRLQQLHDKRFAVSGSPADCVYMATRFLLKRKPDLIISGINKGANLGDDHFYSGTVAAAREGALFGIRSIAVSLCLGIPDPTHQHHWETAAEILVQTLPSLLQHSWTAQDLVMNLNVPDLPLDKIKGLRSARQGRRQYANVVTERSDPRGKPYYWVGGNYEGFTDIPESDCVLVQQGYAALVPLRTNTTDDEWKLKLRGLEWSSK